MTLLELLRRERGLKQTELSKKSGVAQHYISAAESKRYALCKMHLNKLAYALEWEGNPEDLQRDASITRAIYD